MLAKQEHQLLREIYYLTNDKTKNWRKLLELGTSLQCEFKRKLLWVWPTPEDLLNFKGLLRELDISRLLSIGCGNGLLEWILREGANVSVYGLEIDRNWWQCKYAVQSFIQLKYAEDNNEATSSNRNKFLPECCAADDWDFALLFCYFNNRAAFLNYLNLYHGKWIVIIGPSKEGDVHTDPAPLTPEFPANEKLELRAELSWSAGNCVAFYERYA